MNGHAPGDAPPEGWDKWRAELYTAFAFLTRLPLPTNPPHTGFIAKALRLSPIIGAFIGALSGSFYWLGLSFGLSPLLAALLGVGIGAIVTGGLHEDALCDMADGISGGSDREHRLTIMSDGRIGAHGALALMLVLLLRVGAIAQLSAPGPVMAALIGAGALSRAAMFAAMAALPNAKQSGLAHMAGRPDLMDAMLAAGLGFAIALLAMPFGVALDATLAAASGGALIGWIAARKIGGQTGDVLGTVQQISELFVLLMLASVLSG